MKNKFWAGFLSGLAGAILLIAIGFGVSRILAISNANFGKDKELSTSDKEESSKVDDVVKKLDRLDKLIDRHYMEEVDEEALVEGIYKGYVAGLGDPYSNYFTRQEYKDLMESSNGIYFGIGASVSQDITTGIIKIVKPFVSSPAYEEGLLPEDILYKVDGEEVTGKDLTEVVSKIKGPEGATTDLTIIR
ncbi:MAG TPA: PDZ domain-containing protein, partial [Clostridiales bacterium]|nr:PDZ domain-containing protein [Clostridiales bacterium]